MSGLFSTFYLDNRGTGRLLQLGNSDYVLAALFASLYVLARTASILAFGKALLVNLVFVVLGMLSVFATSLLPDALAVIALIAIILVLAIEQARTMVRHVVRHYMDNGYDMTPG